MILHFLTAGMTSERRALAILSPIPTGNGSLSVDELRPLCLQNVLFRWLPVPYVPYAPRRHPFPHPPQEQKGFMRLLPLSCGGYLPH